MPYLPPLPFRGSGVHRMVFTLYRHMQLLPFSCSRSPSSTSGGSWYLWLWNYSLGRCYLLFFFYWFRIDQRTFCSQNFVSTHSLVPFTFSFYQTLWDDSVSYIFSETLGNLPWQCVSSALLACPHSWVYLSFQQAQSLSTIWSRNLLLASWSRHK